MKEQELSCEECGSTHEVIESLIWWIGEERNEGKKKLCYECEHSEWDHCSECEALIDLDHSGSDSDLPDDYDGILCPDCAGKWLDAKR